MARISTHVLDIDKGKPAAGIAVRLYRADELLASAVTNPDGRTDEPLLNGDAVATGAYRLVFETASPFFPEIAIAFAVSDPHGNYHVPLLLAAHGYSTYRGS